MSKPTLDANVKRLVGQAVAQGFPEKCGDLVTMAKVAAALNGHGATTVAAKGKSSKKVA